MVVVQWWCSGAVNVYAVSSDVSPRHLFITLPFPTQHLCIVLNDRRCQLIHQLPNVTFGVVTKSKHVSLKPWDV